MKRISKVLLFTILLSINMMIVKADECGLSDDMYVIVEDTLTNESKRYDSDSFDVGSLTSVYENVTTPFTYKASIYSDKCGEDPINVLEFEHKATLNRFSGRDICMSYGASELCGAYYDTSSMSDEDFEKELQKWEELQKKELDRERLMYFFRKSLPYVLMPMIIIILFFVIRIVVLKVKTNKEGRLSINEKNK